MAYRPKIKNDNNGTLVDLPLDAETLNGKSDSDFVDKTSTQTITGSKTMKGELKFQQSSDSGGTTLLTIKNDNGYNAKIKMGNTENIRLMTNGTYFGQTVGAINNNTTDLGTSSVKWKDLYMAGKLSDGNNANYGLVLPNTTSYTGNRTIATLDDITGGGSGGDYLIPYINVASSTSSQELDPNKFYDFGGRKNATLTITLGSEISGYLNEFMGEITADEGNVTLNTPTSITWKINEGVGISNNVLTLAQNYTYQFSIINKLGVIISFPIGTLGKPIVTLSDGTLAWDSVANAENYEVFVNSTSKGEQTATTYDIASDFPSSGKLATPSNISGTITQGTSTSSVALDWDDVSNADSYTVGYNSTSTSSTTSNKTISSLTNGQTYTFTIQAIKNLASASYYVKAISQKAIDNQSATGTYYYKNYENSDASSGYAVTIPYSITKSLTNLSSSGDTAILPSGTANVTLSVNDTNTYTYPDTVSVTNATHSYSNSTGAIALSSPTGNVTITASAKQYNFTITKNITNGTASGDTNILLNSTASVTITPNTNYSLPSTISVSGASYTYNNSTGVVSLSNPTANVTISATCPLITYTITTNLTNLTSNSDDSINAGGSETITLTASSGYDLPSSSSDITVTNATLTSYDSSTGVLVISNPTGNVTITASGVAQVTGYNVTITFQNGVDNEEWYSTKIYDGYYYEANENLMLDSNSEIGTISSANGSTTITTTTGKIAIICLGGAITESYGSVSTTNGITLIEGHSGFQQSFTIYFDGTRYSSSGHDIVGYTFEVEANGTITISGADWYD